MAFAHHRLARIEQQRAMSDEVGANGIRPERKFRIKKMKDVASIVMAAGRGTRMKGYEGNKTLLPLIPGESPYKGDRPILLHILESLPAGPKAVVVHYRKEDIIEHAGAFGAAFYEQPVLNGTGGALLAAKNFITRVDCGHIVVTMGDVPFVRPDTYLELIKLLDQNSMVVLGFVPRDKKRYGAIEIAEGKVLRIVEWKYWHAYPASVKEKLLVCNSGIYAFNRNDLIRCLPVLESHPQRVIKEIDGKQTEIEEYFVTDIVEHMVKDDLKVGYALAEDETEAMGVDDLPALINAQKVYSEHKQ
jgi:bifunctional UDP-N-acetylglucosamine pyrophosphorylase / glucosamine-1-phosphate N-acetyltransferase